MSINPKSLKEIIKIKFDDFFYFFQNNNSYRLSIKKLTEYITDNVLSVLPPILDKHSQLDLDDGTNPHGTTKSDVGLGNVDNTSDVNKPISSATALEFVNVYNEIFTKANNYVDIANIISGYILTDTDAGKLITNSGVNVRTLVIPSSLNLPNNTIFIKGRIAIQPNAGVNIELPDTTIITSPTQFTCEADKMYVLHRKQFTGDEWILVELGTVLLTDGNGTTANGLSIDLGGVLNPEFTLIKGATDGSSLLFFGGNAADENLGQLMVNAQSVILNALTSYDGNGGGHIVNLNPGGFESTNYLTDNTSSSIGNYSAGNYLNYYDNRKFNLQINSPGIAPGSGESFTINGVTFTEGIDFTGQSDEFLDTQAIAALNYSGVTDFVSVTYIDNVVYFTFSNIATISKTIANSLFTRRFYKVEVSSDFNGLTLKDGGDGFSINKFLGEYTFTDTTTSPKGIKYADNYDATLEDDSLVPKRYVDNQVATKISEVVDDSTPQLGGDLDLNGNDINGTGNVDITGNVIADIVQLKGGTGTQGEMSWSTDEETVQLVMDGTTLHIGQDTFVHVRNNTASIITKGTAVYATGTLGASGRITVAPMIANGTIPGRLFIGLAAEDIAIGADGQVCSYGKIRGINTTAYNDGDVLWLSPTVAGQLTTTEPTAPNLKIATAFVIHAANNGTLMVRAEQGTDLHTDQRVQVSGLTNNDVLTWNNANQRWENAQLTLPDAYGGKRYTLIKSNGTQQYYDNLSQVSLNWADGDVLHQFADETDITYVNVSGGIMYAIPSISWIGNGFKTKVNTINVSSGQAFNIAASKTVYFNGVDLSSEGINTTGTLVVAGTLYNSKDTTIRVFIQLARSSSYAVGVSGTMYGGLVIPEGVTEPTNLYPNGIGGAGFYYNVDTRGFQLGIATNFIGGSTTYPCATNFRDTYCDFGDLAIGGGRTFDNCQIRSTRNNNGTSNFQTFVARNCTIIHTPSANTHTFYNIPNIILINCTFISSGYLCASFGGTAGYNIIQGGYYSFAGQVNFAANNYAGLVQISDCTIEATNPSATTDILLFTNAGSTNVKINNVTFKNAGGRSDIRVLPANNVEWKNCKFSKGNAHISVSSGTVADAINNNPARLLDPKGFLNNTGNGNWFNYVPMTTAEITALTNVSKNFTVENTTKNIRERFNGTAFKEILELFKYTTAEMNAIVSPVTNLLVFNTDLNGLYRYNGSAWVALSTGYGIISVNDVSGAPTYYATFKSAVDAIGGNGVVNLHSNISVTAVGEMPTIGTNDTLTINGNGYTITHTCNSGSDFHLVDCTSNTAKIYLNNVKIVSNGTASGSYVASVFGGITNSPSLIELSSDSIITTTNNGIREFGTIRGGTLICSNGLIAIATTIKNAEVTTKYASASMFNCNVTVVSGGYIGSGGAYEINGCNITGDATSVTPIRLEPNAKFWNNNVVITTGSQDAIYIQSGTPDKWININNCYIRHLGTGRGIFGENVSEIHNTTVYAESNVACYTQQGYPAYAYNGHTIKNCTFITNSTTHSAYSSLNVNTRSLHNVTAVCRNASNTAPAFNINMGYASAILTVTDCQAIVNNASAYNFQTTGSSSGAYIYGLKMSVIGLGMNLSTTLLNTNTPDAFGNIKIG